MGTTTIERMKKLQEIRDLLERGYSERDISDRLQLNVRAVQRYKKQLTQLGAADLTPQEISTKRAEAYLDLVECLYEARDRYNECVLGKDWKYAKQFLDTWVGISVKKARLYGIDTVKPFAAIQINNMQQPALQDPRTSIRKFDFDGELSDEIIEAAKTNHKELTYIDSDNGLQEDDDEFFDEDYDSLPREDNSGEDEGEDGS